MQCPRCKCGVTEGDDACPRCGRDLNVFRSLRKMQDDLDRIRGDASSFSNELDELRQQFIELEDLVSGPPLGDAEYVNVAEKAERAWDDIDFTNEKLHSSAGVEPERATHRPKLRVRHEISVTILRRILGCLQGAWE